jgi:hypothetical protein
MVFCAEVQVFCADCAHDLKNSARATLFLAEGLTREERGQQSVKRLRRFVTR